MTFNELKQELNNALTKAQETVSGLRKVLDYVNTAPAQVSCVASVDDANVTVTFGYAESLSPVVAYRVYRGGSQIASVSASVSASPYMDTNLADGTYVYAVAAVNEVGVEAVKVSAASVTVQVTPPAPGAPVYDAITAFSTSRLDHSWAASTQGGPTTSYTLDRSLTGTGSWTNVYTGTATTFSDTGLSADTQYFYRLLAFNGVTPSVSYSLRQKRTLAGTGAINFNPGFYWMTGRSGSSMSQQYRFNSLYGTAASPKCFAGSQFKGVSVEFRWKDLESTQGSYPGIALIKAEIDRLITFSPAKRLWIQWRDEKRNITMSKYTDLFPTYLGPNGLNVIYQYLGGETGSIDFVSWNINSSTAQARFTALWTALIAGLKLGTTALGTSYWDYIEGFRPHQEIGSERFGTSIAGASANVTAAQYQAHQLAFITLLRSLAPDKAIIVNPTNCNDKVAYLSAAVAIDCLLGHGDCLPRGASGIATGDIIGVDQDLCGTRSPHTGTDYRVLSRLWMGTEGSQLGHTADPTNPSAPFYLIPELNSYMDDPMEAVYKFWDIYEGNAADVENYQEIIAYVSANPSFNSSPPPHY